MKAGRLPALLVLVALLGLAPEVARSQAPQTEERQNYQRFRQLPPEERERLREQWKKATPAERERLRERHRGQQPPQGQERSR